MSVLTGARWIGNQGMFTFGGNSPAEIFALMKPFGSYADRAASIQCPVLIMDSAAEQFFAGQSQKLADILTCPQEVCPILVGGTGAEAHCQCGGIALSHQVMFDWLDEVLKK